jgi:hypothetical protein
MFPACRRVTDLVYNLGLPAHKQGRSAVVIPLVLSALFVVLGILLLPYSGFEDDEAAIVSGFYSREGFPFDMFIGGHRIALMLWSYVGALKSLIYAPVFSLWNPSVYSVRVPAILLGAATIWLFYCMLTTLAGSRAALIGAVLLSTDTTFLLTTCFDWGPVMLQHLLLVSSVLSLLNFASTRRYRHLIVGFFLLGLGLWDKALFAWMLGGMTVGAMVTFPKRFFGYITLRNVSTACLAFCLGAAPLIAYNISVPMATFRTTTSFSTEDFAAKKANLYSAFSGQALFGYLVRNDAQGFANNPSNAIESGSVMVSKLSGHPIAGFSGYATLVALLVTPFLRSVKARKTNLFLFVTMLVAWAQMLITKGAGTSAHHVILLWPFPAALCGIALAGVAETFGRWRKAILVGVLLFFATTNLLVTNEYLARFIVNGPGLVWTDAIDNLSGYLQSSRFDAIYVTDWGIIDGLWLLSRGSLPLRVGTDPLTKTTLNDDERKVVLDRISNGGAVFVGHVETDELFQGVRARLAALASEAHYKRETLTRLEDRHGRLMFEVYRFTRQ